MAENAPAGHAALTASSLERRSLGIGFLNGYNSSESIKSTMCWLASENEDWILGVNEPNTRNQEEKLLEMNKRIFQSGATERATIIRNERAWTLIWAPQEANIVMIGGKVGRRYMVVHLSYLLL